MLPIRQILVPLDGSTTAESSLGHARAVARPLDVPLHLVRVVPPSAVSDRDGTQDPVRWRLERSDAEAYLAETARELRDDGFETETAVLAGRPAEEIVSYARRNGVDLVVLSRRGKDGCVGAPMGGTAYKVVYRIGTSVLLTPPGTGTASRDEVRYRRLLVPVDGSPASEWALQAAASLLPGRGGELVAARALELESSDSVRGPRRDAEAFLARARRRVSRPGLRLDEVPVVPADQAAGRLHVLAEERDVDLIVLSAHGRSTDVPWPYGSVATNLLLHGRRPTLVLQDQPEPRFAEPPEREKPVRRPATGRRSPQAGTSAPGSGGASPSDP